MSGRTRVRVSNPGSGAPGPASIEPVRSGALLEPVGPPAGQTAGPPAQQQTLATSLIAAAAASTVEHSTSPGPADSSEPVDAFSSNTAAAARDDAASPDLGDAASTATPSASPSPALGLQLPGLFRGRSLASSMMSPIGRRGTKDPANASPTRSTARVAPQHAEVHVVGQLAGASGFTAAGSCVAASWQLVADPQLWLLVRGTDKGRTSYSSPGVPESDYCVWSHPLDLHLASASSNNWPGLLVKVWGREVLLGRDRFVGYAWVQLPTQPGVARLDVPVWAPLSERAPFKETLLAWFTGLTPQLASQFEGYVKDPDLRTQLGRVVASRGVGTLHLQLQVVMARPHLLRPQGGEALRRGLEARQAAAEGVKLRASRGLAAAAAEAEEELLSEGVRLVREGRGARFSSVWNTMSSRGGGADTPRSGDQDTFGTWRADSPGSRPGSSGGSPMRGGDSAWRLRRDAAGSSPGRLLRGSSLAAGGGGAAGGVGGRLARGDTLPAAEVGRLARGGSLVGGGGGGEGETPRRSSPLNSRFNREGAGERGGSPLRQSADLAGGGGTPAGGSPSRLSALQRGSRGEEGAAAQD